MGKEKSCKMVEEGGGGGHWAWVNKNDMQGVDNVDLN